MDAEDMTLEELSVHKSIKSSISDLSRLRKQAIKRVSNALVLYHFLQRVSDKPEIRYNKKLVDTFIIVGEHNPIFYIAEMEWSYSKLAKVLYLPYWEEFFSNTRAPPQSLAEILGMRESQLEHLTSFIRKEKP